jgi:hypothetical protein
MPKRSTGSHVSDKGYIRVSSGKHRDKYAHRVVGEVLIAEMKQLVELRTPRAGWTLHHMDFNKRHNCPSNLLFLSKQIHDALTKASNTFYRENKT